MLIWFYIEFRKLISWAIGRIECIKASRRRDTNLLWRTPIWLMFPLHRCEHVRVSLSVGIIDRCTEQRNRFLKSVRFRMLFLRSEMPICASPCLSERCLWNSSCDRLVVYGPVSLPLKQFLWSFGCLWPSVVLSSKIVNAPSFYASLLQAIGSVKSLAFVPAGSVSSSSTLQTRLF